MVGWSKQNRETAIKVKKYEEWYSALSPKEQLTEDIYKELTHRKIGKICLLLFCLAIISVSLLYCVNSFRIFSLFFCLTLPVIVAGFTPPTIFAAIFGIWSSFGRNIKIKKGKKLCKIIRTDFLSFPAERSQLIELGLHIEVLSVVIEQLRQGNYRFNDIFFRITDTSAEDFIELPATRTKVAQVLIVFWDTMMENK